MKFWFKILAFGSLLTIVLTFFFPTLLDIADYAYVKLTHQVNKNQPLYEELHQARYQGILCGGTRTISDVIYKYVPVGTSMSETLKIMKNNGYGAPYIEKNDKGKETGLIIWDGWDKNLILRRQHTLYFKFKRLAVESAFVKESCFAGI